MRKLIFVLLVGLIHTVLGQGNVNPNGYNKFYYPDGTLSSEGNLKNGKPDGYWKSYHANGNMSSEGNRKEHLLDGKWKFYNEDGVLVKAIDYAQDLKNGKETIFNLNGNPVKITEYRNDTLHGMMLEYDENGRLAKEVPYVEGRKHGMGREYEEGRLITVYRYKKNFIVSRDRINQKDRNGKKTGVWKEYFEDWGIRAIGHYKQGMKHGSFKTYNADGSLDQVLMYENDELVKNETEVTDLKVETKYYEGGGVSQSGGYLRGKKHGMHKRYDGDGNVTAAKEYNYGKLVAEGILNSLARRHGDWKIYFENGKLKAEGRYENGVKVGKWKYYHTSGKVEQTGVYDKKGRFKGNWKWYYPSGELWRDENYLAGKEEGEFVEYSDSADVLSSGEYIEGYKEGKWIYHVGNYNEEGEYRDGEKHGEWVALYKNGNKRFEGEYQLGIPKEKHRYYFENGKVRKEGEYAGGLRHGDWKFYNEDGTISMVITYKNGKDVKYNGVKVSSPEDADLENEELEE